VSGFRPAAGLTVLSLGAVAIFCALGVWQMSRHQWRTADLAEKSARIELAPLSIDEAARAPAESAWRRARARGRFELADTVIVGPAERGRELGARVLTPLRLEGAADDAPRVLVDRGFIPREAVERFLPPDAGTSDLVDVNGLVLELAVPEAQQGSRAQRKTHFAIWNPDRPKRVASLTQQLPYPLLPVMLQSIEPEPGGLPIGEPSRPASPVDHRGYALTWFAVGVLSLFAWIEYGRRRARELAEQG
jgi:surfeit locus 1 family protein